MTRAAVLIGANRTGHLPVLQDAVAGARRMEQWALAQGMARHRVVLFTDEAGPIDVSDIRRAVRALVDSGSLEQLIVYFAGHGVNIRYGEYWLLTDAPEDASAAVNVEGSVVLARRSGIGHVVFISDACRTAAEGVQAQGITGTEIFPNDPVPGPERPVDIFFGATLGRPALEVKDPAISSGAFKAIYTAAFLDAISGRVPAALTRTLLRGQPVDVVRPRPLKTLLLAELPKRLAALRLPVQVTQVPDARITSDDDAWLAVVTEAVAAPAPSPAQPTPPRSAQPRGAAPSPIPTAPRPPTAVPLPVTAEARAQAQLASALDMAATGAPQPVVRSVRNSLLDAALQSLRGLRRSGPTARGASADQTSEGIHFETGCGFEVQGSTVLQAWSIQAQVEVTPDPSRVRVHLDRPLHAAGAVALLQLQDGSGTLLPALRGFVTRLVIEDDELVDVAFEPVRDTPRWPAFAAASPGLRQLRGVVSQAARDNAFRPELSMVDRLSDRMAYAGHLDPALGLYAAYAWHELQQMDRVATLVAALRAELGIELFDLALLSRAPSHGPLLPPLPMLSRGWSLLSALGMPLTAELAGIERHLLPSLWTHFDREGCERLRDLILNGRLP